MSWNGCTTIYEHDGPTSKRSIASGCDLANKARSSGADGAQARLTDVLDGAVFVVNVPRDQFKAAAQVVYMLIKERFFQALNARP